MTRQSHLYDVRVRHRLLPPRQLLLAAVSALFLSTCAIAVDRSKGPSSFSDLSLSSYSSVLVPKAESSLHCHSSAFAFPSPTHPSTSSSRQDWIKRQPFSPSSTFSRGGAPAKGRDCRNARPIKTIGPGVLLPLFLFLHSSQASPFDPQPLPLMLSLCFFNGWYIRVTDHEKQVAFAAIVGSFKHPGANNYTEHYVGLVYADRSGKMQTAHAFPPPDSVTIERGSEGFDGVPSNFTWKAKGVGRLHVGKDEGLLDIDLPGMRATAHFHDRVPWNAERPDTDGPEGWLGRTPLLPCRYFVHSLASRTTYSLRLRPRPPSLAPSTRPPTHLAGQGYAHMESNHGNCFPSAWIWCNAIGPDRAVSLLMVGGKFEIGPSAPTTWILTLRSPRFNWVFRTTDLDEVNAHLQYTTGTLQVQARSRCGRRRLTVSLCAPVGSFGAPIYVPTAQGFSCQPGCRESFTGKAIIRAVDEGEGGGGRIVREETHEVPLAALELGGEMQRM